jgi:UDPglucose--hexose-1-phosphate uridylyltransferase
MSELRQNLATREWVIIATERAKRPEQFVQAAKEKVIERPAYDPRCPFCPGNEELDIERLRVPPAGEWQVRVVQNKFPALRENAVFERHSSGLRRSLSGFGYHEVLIESRLHNTCPALQAVDELERMLSTFQERGYVYNDDKHIEQIIYFKNHGALAGTSLVHPHAQLVGLPVVPHNIRARMEEARRYFDDHSECVFCRMRAEEEREGARVVAANASFTAFIPYAAFSPFHLWIIPHQHCANFLDASADEVRDLSAILREVLRKLYFGLNDPDYNYVIRSAPEHEHASDYLHWYVAIVPRVTQMAGFEMGTGMFINTALPEESAAFLRAVVC